MAEMDEHPDIERTRMLNIAITTENFTKLPSGALKVTNISALAEGEWTDSAVGTPLYYGPRVLESDAGHWPGTGIWARHQGHTPRPITDKVGTIKNPRYDANLKAVVVDGLFHARSQASRDVIQMIEDGEITDVSAEVGSREVWNAETKRYEAASLTFYGLATVDRGACTTCKMPRRNEADDREKADKKEVEQMTDTKELEQKLAALETEKVELAKKADADKAELTKQLEAVSKTRADELAVQKATLDETVRKLAEAEAKITELGKKPATPQTIPGNGESGLRSVAELQVVTPAIIRNGEVSR
jgi:hypothetical protein